MKKLDVRGAKCPIPIVKAKKEVDQMQPGELLLAQAHLAGGLGRRLPTGMIDQKVFLLWVLFDGASHRGGAVLRECRN